MGGLALSSRQVRIVAQRAPRQRRAAPALAQRGDRRMYDVVLTASNQHILYVQPRRRGSRQGALAKSNARWAPSVVPAGPWNSLHDLTARRMRLPS